MKKIADFVLLAVGLLALLGQAVAAGPPAVNLGVNLLNESCEARERDDLAERVGIPTDSQIYCDGNLAGQLAYGQLLSGGNQDVEAARAALLSQYERSAMARTIASRASCAAATWVEASGAATVALLPCQLKLGGWPHLVVLSGDQKILAVADGSALLLPVMLKAAGLGATQISDYSSKDALQKLWGRPIVLASSSDLERFRQLTQQARSASNNFNFAQAEDIFRKALDLQVKLLSENDPAIADTLMDLALTVSNQAKADEAQALFRRAEAIVQKSPFEADRARLATYLGFEAANRQDYEAALKNAEAATHAWRKLAVGNNEKSLLRGDAIANFDTELAELAMALDFQARMALRNDDVVSAGAMASESLLLLNQVKSAPNWWKADVMSTLGEVTVAQGRLSAAETYFNAALAIRRQVFGDGASTLPVLTALGRAYQSEGMNTSAIITFRSAFKIARTLPQSAEVISNEQLLPFVTAITEHAETLSDNNARQGLFAEAFEAFQLARSSLIDKTIAKAQARLAIDDPAIATLVEQLQATQRELEVARTEYAIEQALPDAERSAIVETRLQQVIAQKQRRISELKQQLATGFPAYDRLANPRPIELTEMRKRLGEREAIVSFIIGKKQSFIQLTKRQGNYVAKISEGEAGLAESVAALRRALEIQGGAINEFDLLRSHQLYKALFSRLEGQLQGLDHLIVAGKSALASLPFGLLVTAPPTDGNYSRASWLGQKFAISHTPSMQAFYTLRSAAPKTVPPKVMLAFGDPVLEGAKSAPLSDAARAAEGCRPAGPMDGAVLRALSPLPETSSELNKVAAILGAGSSTLFLRAEANEVNFRAQKLLDYRILYFATHGLLPGELKCQSEPGLVLTPPVQQPASRLHDGLLEASEIAGLKLNADLVVLSACNTAGGAGKFGGEALSGLAESFFFAGARSLVVSHWQVPSAATAQLMSALFATLGPELKGGVSVALQSAQAKLIAQQQTAHPFFWAAFVVVGDGMAASSAQLLKPQAALASR